MSDLEVQGVQESSVPQRVDVAGWPSEIPLRVVVIIASLAVYGALVLSVFGALYGVAIAAFVFVGHLLFVTHLRGSGVRLGPEQFPELFERVTSLSRAAGMAAPPTAYVLQAGGSLNALATKLFRGRIIVLYADLLEACGDDEAARDMVIGHEIGHHRAGHLDWVWLTLPGRFVPFLGAAYSRACERTCDRWGAALCGDRRGALRGLAILAAGGLFGPLVNLAAFVDQRRDLDTGWMTIGRWLSGYPTLSERVHDLDASLAPAPVQGRGPIRAAGLLLGCLFVPLILSVVAGGVFFAKLQQLADDLTAETYGPVQTMTEEEIEQARKTVEADLGRLEAALEGWVAAGRPATDDMGPDEVWAAAYGFEPCPEDPFDGYPYGMLLQEDDTVLFFSSGPDGEAGTPDDINREVQLGAGQGEEAR